MRCLRIGSEGYGRDMVLRLLSFGVGVYDYHRISRFPDFPLGIDTPCSLDCGGMGDDPHVCEHESIIYLPTVLVFEVNIRGREKKGSSYRTFKPVTAFHTGRAMIVHEGYVPNPSEWKMADAATAVCALGANPWLGSVRFFNPQVQSNSSQAYVWEGKIVTEENGSGIGHHVLYISTACPDYRQLKLVH